MLIIEFDPDEIISALEPAQFCASNMSVGEALIGEHMKKAVIECMKSVRVAQIKETGPIKFMKIMDLAEADVEVKVSFRKRSQSYSTLAGKHVPKVGT